MGKEGSESTETMDEDREKRWEGERKVFCGRVDSFIARMHLVQGDRRFSKWKGSVVDSIIGVFLTQNVSDHLSSSAYMSLAAKFTLQPTTIRPTCCQNGGSPLVEGRQVQIKLKESQHSRNITYQVMGNTFPDKRPLLGNQQLENSVTNRENPKLDRGSIPHAYLITANALHHQTPLPLSSNYRFSTTTDLEEWEARFLGLSGKETVSSLTPTAFEITSATSEGHALRDETFKPGSVIVTEPERHAEALSEKPSDNLRHMESGTKTKGFEQVSSSSEPSNQIGNKTPSVRKRKVEKEKAEAFNWDSLRKQVELKVGLKERSKDTEDSLDYEALRNADVREISETIKERGMNNMLAERIKDFLDRLIREHGRIDLEWLRHVPPDKSKDYLLSIRGLGLKSVECVRLLTLHHLAFPVDTNVGRIAVRLGWVPLQPLPESLQLHLLELYPVLESIQKYLWPRLCNLDQKTLYELHYQMITFGKVFCTKREPNCNACPMRGECRHFASAFASARLALPGPEEGRIVSSAAPTSADKTSDITLRSMPLPPLEDNLNRETGLSMGYCEPIIEEPTTPEQFTEVSETDIEYAFYEDPDEIPTIKINIEQFTTNLQSFMQGHSMEIQKGDMSKALVALSPELASIPMPKLKNVNRLRTEHQVYELPDSHSLLQGLDRRELDDPSPYLLAIWTPGETADSIQPPESRCNSQDLGGLCDKNTCLSCNSVRETQSQTVRGTLLIPCRTAMRGSFPLNGTYFQVNEVFAGS
ncbi:Protein ROS1 [Abeliophyllum distichum]|uniref:Protein ROS1 n=1 Tax=Abeliophyllum distichum TaxID=126358 RepID=A0ABD1VRD7_9LAMI